MVTMEVDRVVGREAGLDIDEVRYSRLIHALGREAVERLFGSKVLIVGSRGIGAEVSKNLLLSGVSTIALVDDATVSIEDLGSHMLLKESDVGSNRAAATARALRELAPGVDALPIAEAALESSVKDFQVVVMTSGTYPDMFHVNRMCREAGVMFTAALSRGVFSYVFVDFGDCFSVLDESGEPAGFTMVDNITQDFPATVTVVEEHRHGLEDGDEVVFSGIIGMDELNHRGSYPVTVTGTCSFTIPEDTRSFGRCLSGGYFCKKRPAKKMCFLPMDKSIRTPEFCISDPAKAVRAPSLHVAFQAVDEHERQRGMGSSCMMAEDSDVEEVLKLARELWQQTDLSCGSVRSNAPHATNLTGMPVDLNSGTGGAETSSSLEQAQLGACSASDSSSVLDEELVRLVASGGSLEISPIVSIIGGIAAQEVIKALSRVHTPLRQWLYFDATECLPSKFASLEDRSPLGTRYDSQTSLFGRDIQQRLSCSKWLVVGAGAIGCEVLKNLVLMGVGCGTNGRIVVTDTDNISKPNLVDQVLYHIDDLERPKTPTAARVLRRMNPAAQIVALQEKFDVDSENVFDSTFLESMTGGISAVDNSTSRLYIDRRCVSYGKPMINGGKHGTKGSVQVFVPSQSEMYASTRDPPEHKEFPICTLSHFPYAAEHTLQWAVNKFDDLFKQRPLTVNSYLSKRDSQEVIRKSPDRQKILETLRDALVRQRTLSFEACIQWARTQFEDLFSNEIKQLLFNFPAGVTKSPGIPFWSGTKRVPTPLEFNPLEPLHMEFIIAAANLQATVYGLRGCSDQSSFLDALQRVTVPSFQPKEGIKIAESDNEIRNNHRGGDDNDDAACEAILKELPTPTTLVGYRLSPIDFEKDDEVNFHTEFIAAAANLRALNYRIPSTSKLQARLICGRVIPAISTSTSVIGGLICLELYKVLQRKSLSDYRHSYFNLAVPMFSFAQPLKAVEYTAPTLKSSTLTWTLWDRFEMDCVGMTLESFLSSFKDMQGLEIIMISYGKSLLYAEFLARKKLQERLRMTLVELVTTVAKVPIPPTETKLFFSITCTDANNNDVEAPDVVARVR